MLQLFYMYVLYCFLLNVWGIPLYSSHYRCTRDQFDYYERVRFLSREKHIWTPLPDHVNTCEVPYYIAYCISTPFNYSFRLPMKSNHYESIAIRNRVGMKYGSYRSNPNRTHPSVKFDILCLPTCTISNTKKRYYSTARRVSKREL